MGWHFSFRRRRNKNKASSSNGKAAPVEPAVAEPSREQAQERQPPRPSRSNSKETTSSPPQAQENAPPACPLVVTASIRFPDSGVGSLYSREYRSSPDFDPTERICRGLLRRIEYGSEELITRKDSSALDHNGPHSSKPLRYEMHFKIVRHGSDVWAERTFKSYQKHPVFYHAATELAAATHRLVGLYLHQHDTGFKWTGDPLRDYLDEPEVAKPTFEGPLSLNSVPRDRFVETSQSFEFVPGFTIEIAFRSRSQQRTQQDWKRTSKLSSKQGTPLTLGCAEELLYQSSKVVNEEYEKMKEDFDSRHRDCEMLEGAVGCHHFEQDALEIDLRIFNNLGPDFDHLRRFIRTRLALFCDEDGADCESFLRTLQTRISESRDQADTKLSQMNDLDFRILELSGRGWLAKDAARFTFDASVIRSRRVIEATLDRVQTGVVDVLRGHDVAAHIGAYKRGHHVLDKALIARSSTGAPTETSEDPEAQKAELVTKLEARIQEDLDMICKDTCSLADIPDDKLPQQLDEPKVDAKEEVEADAQEEDVPDVVEVPVSEYSAVEMPMESVSEMPTPPATPPGPRYFPLVPLKYRPEIPVRTSSASSHISGILGVSGEVHAAREEASLEAPNSPANPEVACRPSQIPDGAPILTRDFCQQEPVPQADGQVLRRKVSVSDLKVGAQGLEQDGESQDAFTPKQQDTESESSMSVRFDESEASEPAGSPAEEITAETSHSVGAEAAGAPEPTATLLSSSEVETPETEPPVAESVDELVQLDLPFEDEAAPPSLDIESGLQPDQLQDDANGVQQETLDTTVEEAQEPDAEKGEPENDLAAETARDAEAELSWVGTETPASPEPSVEPQHHSTDGNTLASKSEPVIEPIGLEVHEAEVVERQTQDTEAEVSPEPEDTLRSDNLNLIIPEAVSEEPVGQEEVSLTHGVSEMSVPEETAELPVVEKITPAQDNFEVLGPTEPLMKPEDEPLAEAPVEFSNAYEGNTVDGSGTSHDEMDATITQSTSMPLVEAANEPSPSSGPVAGDEAESKVDADIDILADAEVLPSSPKVEERSTEAAEEVDVAVNEETSLPFEPDMETVIAQLEMGREAESASEPDTPVPERVASVSTDLPDDRDRPQTPPDARGNDVCEDPVTPYSRESDNESLAPSTPALSCGDDVSPETSILTTPIMQRSSIIQDMPVLADEEAFAAPESHEHKPDSAAKSMADLGETPESGKDLPESLATGVSSATELVHFVSEPEVVCPVPSVTDKRSVKLWNAEHEAIFEDDFSRTKSDFAFDHEADLFSSDDSHDEADEEEPSLGSGDFETKQASDVKEQFHVRNGRHSATPEPPERRMPETDADCDTDGAEGDESNVETTDFIAEQAGNSIFPEETADLSGDVDKSAIIGEPAEPDTSENPVGTPADAEDLQLTKPDGAEEMIEPDVKQLSLANLPEDPPVFMPTPSDPEPLELAKTEPSGPDINAQEQQQQPTQSVPPSPLRTTAVTRTLTTKSSTSSSGWEDCSSSFVSATTRPRDSVDSIHSAGEEEENGDSLPPLHATTGYLGLHESRLVEYGLRGALTGSRRFDAAFLARPSTAPATSDAASEARETRSATSSSRTLRLRRQRRAHSAAVVTGAHHHPGKRAARRTGGVGTPVEKEKGGRRRSSSLPPARERKTRPDDVEAAAAESSDAVLPRMMRMFSGFRGRH